MKREACKAEILDHIVEILVAPQRWLDPAHREHKPGLSDYASGGKYLAMPQNDDLTGRVSAGGTIDVSSGRPSFVISKEEVVKPSQADGRVVRTNLFKKSAGWRWLSDNPPETATLVSVETRGQHHYALMVNFRRSLVLARFASAASEPRLRPSTHGRVEHGATVGQISVRGRIHPVYNSIDIF